MAEETPIFAKKPTKTKNKLVIVAIIIAVLAVIGGTIALILILVLNQPDYEKMSNALNEIKESSQKLDLSGTDFAYLPNGRFTKTTHDRYIKNAKDDLKNFREHLDVIKNAANELEQAGAAKSDVAKQYEKFKSKADDLLPKLESAAGDMEKYIEFSDRYYNSKLVVLDSYSSDYSSLKELTDGDIDKIFQPLKEASSTTLREFAEGMSEYIKAVAKFYSKYADYLDGTKAATDETRKEVEKDTAEIEKMTDEITELSDISEDDIFDFTERDLTGFNEVTEKLADAVRELL